MKIKLGILYALFLICGMMNLAGILQDVVRLLSSPLVVGTGIWLFIEMLLHIRDQEKQAEGRFIWWSIAVIIIVFAFASIGMHTEILYSSFRFGEILQPQISSVPVAIGFLWYSMLVSSTAIALKTGRKDKPQSPLMLAVIIAMVMVGFDSALEPAAVKLGYWAWAEGYIPMLNYYSWFILSYILVAIALTIGALPRSEFRFGTHAFAAQLAYYLLTITGMMLR